MTSNDGTVRLGPALGRAGPARPAREDCSQGVGPKMKQNKVSPPSGNYSFVGVSTRSRGGYGTTLFTDLVFNVILQAIPRRVAAVALYALHLCNIAGFPTYALRLCIILYVTAHAPEDLIVSLLLDSLPVSISAKSLRMLFSLPCSRGS